MRALALLFSLARSHSLDLGTNVSVQAHRHAAPVRRQAPADQSLSSHAHEEKEAGEKEALLNVTMNAKEGVGEEDEEGGKEEGEGGDEEGGSEEGGEEGKKEGGKEGEESAATQIVNDEIDAPTAAHQLCSDDKFSHKAIEEAFKKGGKDHSGLLAEKDTICKRYAIAKEAELAAAYEAKAVWWKALVAVEERSEKEAEEKAKAIEAETKKALSDFKEGPHGKHAFAPSVALGLLLLLRV